MNIRLADNTDAPQWDAFVEGHQEASPYHLWAWKKAVEQAYCHRGYYLLAEENRQIVGVLPLIHMQLSFLSNQLVSLPFCDIGGCLASSPETEAILIDEAIKVGRTLKANSIDIRTRKEQIQSAARQVSASCDKVSMLLDLPQGSKVLWENFKSKLRSQVNRSSKNGLIFAWGNIDAVNRFYDVFSSNMRDLGSPVHSKAWILAILNHYGDAARMGLIYNKEGAAIGGGIILVAGKRVSIPWASTLREYNNLSPNMLLYWSFLEYTANAGYDCFDFGRSTPGEGTYKFKAQWGAEPKQLCWHTVSLEKQEKEHESATRKSTGNRERLASLWSCLPLWAANLIGPCLRRHISL